MGCLPVYKELVRGTSREFELDLLVKPSAARKAVNPNEFHSRRKKLQR